MAAVSFSASMVPPVGTKAFYAWNLEQLDKHAARMNEIKGPDRLPSGLRIEDANLYWNYMNLGQTVDMYI